MLNTPVLLIIFNRPDTTQRVFESIRKAQPKKLYVAGDGIRKNNNEDNIKCIETREIIIKSIDWDCELKTFFQQTNLGCSLGPITALNWFFENEEKGIILEDDCLPSQSFYKFCEELLIKYQDDEKILAISGSNFDHKYTGKKNNSYTFSRVVTMWGWATWRRSTIAIDYKLTEWEKVKNKITWCYMHFRQNLFDTDINWYKHWVDKFDKTITMKNITWWDWQWVYYQIANKKYSIIPDVNLVTNIGFSEAATHTHDKTNPASNLTAYEIDFPLIHPDKKKANLYYEEKILKWVLFYHKRLPWHFYIRHYAKEYIKGLLSKYL